MSHLGFMLDNRQTAVSLCSGLSQPVGAPSCLRPQACRPRALQDPLSLFPLSLGRLGERLPSQGSDRIFKGILSSRRLNMSTQAFFCILFHPIFFILLIDIF